MTDSRFISDSPKGLSLFSSVEEANRANMTETIKTAARFGFDTTQNTATGSVYCGRHSTALLVEVFPDGTWMFIDSSGDEPETESGLNAQTLAWHLEGI